VEGFKVDLSFFFLEVILLLSYSSLKLTAKAPEMDAWNASVSFWDIAYFQGLKKLLVSRRLSPVQAKNLLEVIDLDGNGKAVSFSIGVHFGAAWWLSPSFLQPGKFNGKSG